jgi:SAM-dependent methyltransferase
MIADRIQVTHAAGGQVVDDRDVVPVSEQPLTQMTADETRTARNQRLHVILPDAISVLPLFTKRADRLRHNQPALPKTRKTREPQYQRSVDLARERGLETLGLMSNQVWQDDPRRLAFVLARYKFVAKMLEGRTRVAEVGCADAFGTRIVAQAVGRVTAYDFDPIFIEDAAWRSAAAWPFDLKVHDIVKGPLPQKFDAVYCLDLLEHIPRRREQDFLANLRRSLLATGALIVGTPSLESQRYASPQSKAGHVNCKSGATLVKLLRGHFSNVFLFSMNDEVVHTGFAPMAHYLLAICTGPLARRVR